MKKVAVTGAFDNLKSRDVRLLQAAAKLGQVQVLLPTDETIRRLEGREPKFPLEERRYLMQAIRFVSEVLLVQDWKRVDTLPAGDFLQPDIWVVGEGEDNQARRDEAAEKGVVYKVIKDTELPDLSGGQLLLAKASGERPAGKKVLVTGCFDWFHSGHVRFFEEVSELGDLYVVVGHDENVRLLKGEDHPMFDQDERRYMVGAIRYVRQALISSGHGWLDAEPEFARVRPDMYAVNEDGDKPEKRAFCEEQGIEYVVLKRLPKPGLPKRVSTALRGF